MAELQKLKRYEIAGAILNFALACILHLVYDWSGKQFYTALFSSVDESVTEHIKIFAVPYIFWAFIEIFCIDISFKQLATAKITGLYVLAISIPLLFYTYTGILGKNYLFADIMCGVLAIIAAYSISYRLAVRCPFLKKYFGFAVLMFALYVIFTVYSTMIALGRAVEQIKI